MFDESVFTSHAHEQMSRRGITAQQVREVLASPESINPVRTGRIVVQGMITIGSIQTPYLLRVFIDVDRSPPEIVTVYQTSKITRYRGGA
jgi:hypothetical protein